MTSHFFSFYSKAVTDGFDTVWVNDEENKVPIIDGKISFVDENTGGKFELFVTQVKGRGVADADKLKMLSAKHKIVLRILIQWSWETYTANHIKTYVERHFRSQGIKIDPNHYNRTISELLRRKCLTIDDSTPPHYTLTELGKKCYESGKFE
ncbi:MAG: hypothetical protein H8D23_01425 [Candidatus Brocadiales bacterium]|nr:hypothetical protein [Candidatus Brocadiales bacterium]